MSVNKKVLLILGICIISFSYFTFNKITYFDYEIDEPLWVHRSKIQENRGFVLETGMSPPLPVWINGVMLKMTQDNMSPRFASFAVFMITLAITYKMLKKLNFNKTKKMLLIAALLINPYFILYSRTAMTDIHYFGFIWLSLLSLYIYLEKKQKNYLTYSAIFFSLSALTKHTSILFYPLFIITITWLQKKGELTKKDTIRFIKYSSLGFIFLGTVNIIAFLNTGEIYSFLSRIITIINILPFIEIAANHTLGTLITNPAELVIRATKYIIAVTIYTIPFLILLTNRKKRNIKKTITTNQKYILLIILGMFAVSLFLKEGYIRQLIVIYPVIYLFTIKNIKPENIIKPLSIFIVYCLIINIYAFSLFNTKVFGSSKDYLENVSDTKLRLFEYINSNTALDDVVVTNVYPDIINARESKLSQRSVTNPPENTKYIIYDPYILRDKKERKDIEDKLKKYHTLEKTFEYKNNSRYYIYRVNKNMWDEKEKPVPVEPILLLSDII